MGKSLVIATHQSTIPLTGLGLLCVLSILNAGCRSPLTKDISGSGSTLSVFERPDSDYQPGEGGFKSSRLQPNISNGKRAPKGNPASAADSANFNDNVEADYDIENDPNVKVLQKQLFRRQQIAVKNMRMNSDDVANPDRIRSERDTKSRPSSKGEGYSMQFSDEDAGANVDLIEPEHETLVVNERRDQTSSRSKSNKEPPVKAIQSANSETEKNADNVQPKTVEVKPEPVQKASATENAVFESATSREPQAQAVDNNSEVTNASAISNVSSKSEEPSAQELVDWQVHARRAIAALETEQQKTQLTPELKQSLEGAFRLMSLATGDLDNALKPIEKMPSDEQQYVRNTIQALHHAFDPEGNPLASRRYALVLESNRKAQTSAATVANLEVRNVAFCTEVDRYGMITKFPQYQFQAKQECLLYCEVDNFVAVPVKGGFETELQGSYEIVDSSGRRVADELLPLDKDFCSNLRRDYFIPYRIYMPNDIQPGKYQLKLTIEDMKGRKFGQSIVDFRIGQ